MKRIIPVVMMLIISINSFSQVQADTTTRPISNLNAKFKKSKTGLIFAGSCIAAGALINVIGTYQQEPELSFDKDYAKYDKDMANYKRSQRDFKRITSMFYGFGGASLIAISFNF